MKYILKYERKINNNVKAGLLIWVQLLIKFIFIQ